MFFDGLAPETILYQLMAIHTRLETFLEQKMDGLEDIFSFSGG
jgi:hypothetical protein